MRRKKQIQAMQQELALLRQTIDSGKELAALATNTAQQLKKPSIKTVAVQLMRSPRFRRTALIVGGAVAWFYYNTDPEAFDAPAVTAGGTALAVNGYEWNAPVMGGVLFKSASAPATPPPPSPTLTSRSASSRRIASRTGTTLICSSFAIDPSTSR